MHKHAYTRICIQRTSEILSRLLSGKKQQEADNKNHVIKKKNQRPRAKCESQYYLPRLAMFCSWWWRKEQRGISTQHQMTPGSLSLRSQRLRHPIEGVFIDMVIWHHLANCKGSTERCRAGSEEKKRGMQLAQNRKHEHLKYIFLHCLFLFN